MQTNMSMKGNYQQDQNQCISFLKIMVLKLLRKKRLMSVQQMMKSAIQIVMLVKTIKWR